MLPSVSLPDRETRPGRPRPARPIRADEPLALGGGSQGLRVMPPNQRSPALGAPSVEGLATSTAPASSSRAATVAFSLITRSLNGVAPQLVGIARIRDEDPWLPRGSRASGPR